MVIDNVFPQEVPPVLENGWQKLFVVWTTVSPPAAEVEPKWAELATLKSEVTPIIADKEWVDLNSVITITITPLTAPTDWTELASMSIEISPPGVPPPPPPPPGEVNWWLWGSLAVLAIILVAAIARGRG